MAKYPARPVFHKFIGEELASLRKSRGWSVQQAVIRSKNALTPNVLTHLERGRTKFPEPDTLRAVADLYSINYETLAERFIEANYGSDLIRHLRDQTSTVTLKGGAVDVPASVATRLRELENSAQELGVYKSIVERLRPLLAEALVAVGRESHETPRAATKGRRRH